MELFSSLGQPTKVEFHVTVMSLDSINEGSMVSKHLNGIYNEIDFLHIANFRPTLLIYSSGSLGTITG